MGLVDKLTELDQAIWKQYEKVTQYCNKEYGWDKYDLAGKASNGITSSIAGLGIYLGLSGIETQHYEMLGITGVLGFASYSFNFVFKTVLALRKNEELEQLIESGAVDEPTFGPVRPIGLGVSLAAFATSPYVISQFAHDHGKYGTAIGLAMVMCDLAMISNIFMDYFSDQIMTPPKKKKSVLKTLYEKVTGKLQPVPVPQLEPVKPTKYQSIDDIVGGA